MVPVPDPSNPNNRSFWILPCSKYSGTDLPEITAGSSFASWGLPGGTGNESNEQMKRVDACLPKTKLQLYKKPTQIHLLNLKLEPDKRYILFMDMREPFPIYSPLCYFDLLPHKIHHHTPKNGYPGGTVHWPAEMKVKTLKIKFKGQWHFHQEDIKKLLQQRVLNSPINFIKGKKKRGGGGVLH